jgi:hypothetical protein
MNRILLTAILYGFAFETGYSAEPQITKNVNVVQVHVGKSDSAEDNFVYTAPEGYRIVRYQLHERSRGGDANYSVTKSTDRQVVVHWRAKSKEVKVLGATVNTITAFLTLDMTVDLELLPSPPASIWEKLLASAERLGPRIAVFTFGVVFIITLLILAARFPDPTPFQYTVFRIVLALAAAGIAAFIPGFLDVKVSTFVAAGGAFAVFVIVFFFSPAKLVVQGP